MSFQRLPAEWEPQDATLLIWPSKSTQSNSSLGDIVQLYEALVSLICDYADIVIAICAEDIASVRSRLAAMEVPLEYVYFYPVTTDNIWARDFGPISVQTDSGIKLLNFNSKATVKIHTTRADSLTTQALYDLHAFPMAQIENIDFVLQAGAIETDGQGTLFSTTSYLLSEKRNPQLSKIDIEQQLSKSFGVKKINWLTSGYLIGDDTNGHIDIFVRICPNNTLIYTACDDQNDEHYPALKKMEEELLALTNANNEPYRLIALPWPGPKFNENDERVTASYANFLIVNEAVLVPTYDSLADEDALESVAQAFPGYEIFGVPCLSLIEQGGSLHRIAMQLPEGVLLQA